MAMAAPTPTEAAFIGDMRAAGKSVHWFTFLDGTHAPTVCGDRRFLQAHTAVPLTSRFLGSTMEIVWPAPPAPKRAATCAHTPAATTTVVGEAGGQ